MTYKVGDGKCSVPKWMFWLDPKLKVWADVFQTVCLIHDYDHATRRLPRWESTENFKARLIKRAIYHCVQKRPADLEYLKEGIEYAERFTSGVRIGGIFDWYIKQPLINPLLKWLRQGRQPNLYRGRL